MGQQVVDRHLAPGRHGPGRLQRGRGGAGVDPDVCEPGDEARHRIGELERALLVEGQQRAADDRLGHGVDAKDGVGAHRLAFRAQHAAAPVVQQLAAAVQQRHDAWDRGGVDAALHRLVDAVQSRIAHGWIAAEANPARCRDQPLRLARRCPRRMIARSSMR